MKTCAIIPVKQFSKAKTRLGLSIENTGTLCKLLLEEVLGTISKSPLIEKIILVSKDDEAFQIGKRFDCIEIFDETESSVNNAISLADSWISNSSFTHSVIFPQDIPTMTSSDIEILLGFIKSTNSVVVVPSRQFNGTNALVRCPSGLMQTRYDMGSYTHQIEAAKTKTANISIALIRRIMLDIDDESDLTFMLKQNNKPDFCNKITSCF